jgi:hypothetical protein
VIPTNGTTPPWILRRIYWGRSILRLKIRTVSRPLFLETRTASNPAPRLTSKNLYRETLGFALGATTVFRSLKFLFSRRICPESFNELCRPAKGSDYHQTPQYTPSGPTWVKSVFGTKIDLRMGAGLGGVPGFLVRVARRSRTPGSVRLRASVAPRRRWASQHRGRHREYGELCENVVVCRVDLQL